ncbi:hypothetical protein BC827DRAFT_1288346 [Russula dissimulans]|nr:hypothetical protein BC827DRAFT_1288346 [Russula dissimulans]
MGRKAFHKAFTGITVLNMHLHKVLLYLLVNYVPKTTSSAQPVDKSNFDYVLLESEQNTLWTHLASDPSSHLGYIFSERLVDMTVGVISHMYARRYNGRMATMNVLFRPFPGALTDIHLVR